MMMMMIQTNPFIFKSNVLKNTQLHFISTHSERHSTTMKNKRRLEILSCEHQNDIPTFLTNASDAQKETELRSEFDWHKHTSIIFLLSISPGVMYHSSWSTNEITIFKNVSMSFLNPYAQKKVSRNKQ